MNIPQEGLCAELKKCKGSTDLNERFIAEQLIVPGNQNELKTEKDISPVESMQSFTDIDHKALMTDFENTVLMSLKTPSIDTDLIKLRCDELNNPKDIQLVITDAGQMSNMNLHVVD